MKIPREELLNTLSGCKSGLSTRDLLPALPCFCFSAGQVVTYDDIVACVAPCDLDGFEGGFKGHDLLGWLGAVNGKDVSLEPVDGEDGKYVWKCGRSRLKMDMLPASAFVFTEPDDASTPVTLAEFKAHLGAAAAAMGLDPSHAWREGVTLAFGEKLRLYASDNVAMTEVTGPWKLPDAMKGREVIFPPRLIEIIMGEGEEPTALSIGDTWVRIDYSGKRRVFCRFNTDVDRRKYNRVLTSVDWDKGFYPIPARLERALDEARIVLRGSNDPQAQLDVDEGTLFVKARGRAAEVTDRTTLKTDDSAHPNITVNVNPDTLHKNLDFADEMKIMTGMICLRGDSVRTIIGTIQD